MDIKFYNLDYYPVFIFAIIVGALLAYSLIKRLKELNFYGALSKSHIYNFAFRERVLLYKSIIFFIGFLLLCIVIIRPLWGDKKSAVFEKDRDIIFVLDISKSMLAQDLRPSRIEAAKASIENALPYLFGAKVALVSVAGSSEIRCPLTDDYEFFAETLKNCIPESALLGGSYLNAALEKVTDKLIDKNRANRQNVILISDGGDFVTKSIDNAAQEFRKTGASLSVIGLGDPVYESRIPLKDGGFLSHKEEYVKTKLENEFLKELAFKAGGNYIEIGIKSLNITDILSTITNADTLKVVEDKSLDEYEDRYQTFLLLAIIAFLIWAYPIGYQKKKAILKICIFMFCFNLYAGKGEDLYLEKDYKNAEIALKQDLEKNPKNLEKIYNLAHTQYALGEYEKAYVAYEALLSIAVEIDDFAFQDRLSYDMAVVACMHAQKLASTDVKFAHAKAKKSRDLFRNLLMNASTNEKIPDAFLYHRKVLKEIEVSLKDLDAREKLREEIKAEFVKSLEEQIRIESEVLAVLIENKVDEAEQPQTDLLEKTKNFLAQVEALLTEEKSDFVDVQEFQFLMKALSDATKLAIKEETLCLEYALKKDATKANSYAFSSLINLSAALALLNENTSSLNSKGGESGESGEYEEFNDEDYDEDYNENYTDSSSQKNDLNEGASMTNLPKPEQLEGEILKTEKENNMRREQTRGKYQKVEKDW